MQGRKLEILLALYQNLSAVLSPPPPPPKINVTVGPNLVLSTLNAVALVLQGRHRPMMP
jgi:hypothetical protein